MRFTVSVLTAVLASSITTTLAVIEVDETSYFSTYKPGGLQSGPDSNGGSTFVASATYSEETNSLLLTGSTWGRYFESSEQILDENYDSFGNRVTNVNIVQGCFFADITLPGTSSQQSNYEGEAQGNIFFAHRKRLRTPSSNEACNAIQLFPDTASILIAGHSEERDNETVGELEMVTETKQMGMLFDYTWSRDSDHSISLSGGQELFDLSTIYPTAMTARTNNEEDGLIVVFMQANNEAKHINVKEGEQSRDPAEYFNYGAGYGFGIAMYDFVTTQVTAKSSIQKIQQEWMVVHNTSDTNSQVYVNDVVHIANGLIIVVGTTNGQGRAFGSETDQGNDLDGFIAKISPSTGQLIIEPGFSPSYRVQSKNNKHGNDWANGICHDPNDKMKHIYIVGTTEGKMDDAADHVRGTSAYLMKFDARHMTPIWTKQIGSGEVVTGMACAVSPNGKSVWVGGTVTGVLSHSSISKSHGGKDVYVAKLSTETGEVELMKQLGTDQDDELALRGGLVTDIYGNAVLVGNTYGSFYRTRSSTEKNADVFVMTVSMFDGAIAPQATTKSSSSSSSGVGKSLLWIILVATLGMVLFYWYKRRSSSKFRPSRRNMSTETPRSEVLSYLSAFDVEDIELKHSATGGWHCNFVNKLAKGNFKPRKSKSSYDPQPASGTSGVVNTDFLDGLRRSTSATPEFENEMLFNNASELHDNSESGHSCDSLLFAEQDQGYSDLIGAYNDKVKRSSQQKSKKVRTKGATGGSSTWGKDIV